MHQNPNKGVQCIMFSENLKTLRKQKGFSQEELASRLHVVRQTISKWEKNLSVPDADTLICLAEILEVSVSELLGSKIETEKGNVTNDVAEQLSRINEQLAMKNRRSRRIWKTIVIILASLPCILGFNLLSGFHPLGDGTSVLDLEDFMISNLILPIGSLIYTLFCTSKYGWGWDNYISEVNLGSGLKVPKAIFFTKFSNFRWKQAFTFFSYFYKLFNIFFRM